MSTKDDVKNFGARLKEERERLGLTQAEFGKACGVGRTAQFNYEREERSPSSDYLDALDAAGGDSLYVMTGTRRNQQEAVARAYKNLLYVIEMLMGLKEGELEKLASMAVRDERVFRNGDEMLDRNDYYLAVAAWLQTAEKLDRCLDMRLFTEILGGVENGQLESGVTLSPEKKAKAIVLLYRSFKRDGKVDEKFIAEALLLAVG